MEEFIHKTVTDEEEAQREHQASVLDENRRAEELRMFAVLDLLAKFDAVHEQVARQLLEKKMGDKNL